MMDETLFIMCGVLALMSSALLRSFLGGVLSREFGARSFVLMCVLKSIFCEEFVRLCPPRISVQVESRDI